MPSYVAPGVYVEERDFSDYVAALQQTSVGMVGTAKRGPINVPTLCTTPEQFLSIFGEPTVQSYGPHAALNYLRKGNQLWYVRTAREYEAAAAQIVSMGAEDSSGRIYSFVVNSVTGLNVGDCLRISETGKPTTQNVLITIINGGTKLITVGGPLLSTYSASSTSDSLIELVADGVGAGSAEIFGVQRKNLSVERLVKFTAKDPGDFANFGSRSGIEVVIEDGGQFANLNPSTGQPYESDAGIPLQGVLPSVPSVDTKLDLLLLTAANGGVRSGEMRGVNYDVASTFVSAASAPASSSSDSADDVVLEVLSTAGFIAGQEARVSGSVDFDGTVTVVAVLSDTEIQVGGLTTIPDGDLTDGGAFVVSLENLDSPKLGVLYLCTDNDADGSLGYSTWAAQGVLTKRVRVFYQGRQVEIFDNLIGYDNTSPWYWDTVIGNETTTLQNSSYIYCQYLGSGQQPINSYNRTKHPNNPKMLMGEDTVVRIADSSSAATVTLKNARGHNGDSPSDDDYIGTIQESGRHTGLQNFRRVELYDINLMCVPGISTASVIQEMITILDERNDCLGIIDPPFGLTPQEVVNWHNGSGSYTGFHSAFTTNRAALYYPWVKQHDPYTKRDLFLPPSAIVPGVIAYSDSVGEAWYAPAGITRGKVPNALSPEYVVTKGDVDFFYGPGNGNAVNPIMQFTVDGVVVYGQRTLQRFPSALDRINVRRLLFFIEKSLAKATRRMNFEQNDPILWAQVRNLIEPFMENLKGRRAVEDYRVKCDQDTNTPHHRNNNEVVVKLYVVPTKSAEKLILNVTMMSSGINVDEFISRDNIIPGSN